MTTSETLRSVTRDPTSFIDQEVLQQIVSRFRDEVESIDTPERRLSAVFYTESKPGTGGSSQDEVPATAISEIRLAALLHRFVYRQSDYGDDLDSGLNHSPRKTLLEGGNCADQSLLLYALYREAGIAARITAAEHVDERRSHAFVECGFSLEPSNVIDILGEYYREVGVISTGRFHFFETDDQVYFIADPVASRFLGDRDGLQEMGYFDADGTIQISRRFTLYGDSDSS